MSSLKYEYLYDSKGVLTHISEAKKGEFYYSYFDKETEYIVRDGGINRKHFSLKTNNDFAGIGSGESPEHYNAKMKIVHELKYYDNILGTEIKFDKVIPELKLNNRIPDLSCYDESGNLVMCIEIFNTHKKDDYDIEELKSLKVPIVEIDINNENKCTHLILPEILELNRGRDIEIQREINGIKENISRVVREGKEEVRRNKIRSEAIIRNRRPDVFRVESKIKSIEEEIAKQTTIRIGNIASWLQRRKNRIISHEERSFVTENKLIGTQKLKNRIKSFEREIYRIEVEIERIKDKTELLEQSFNETSKRCKIEWFRPKWMNYKQSDIVKEIKYWLT